MKNIVGVEGENLAKEFLIKNKYKILETNYVCAIGEIDIICFDKFCRKITVCFC